MHVQEHVTGREFSLHLRVCLMKKDFVLAQQFSKKKEMRFRYPVRGCSRDPEHQGEEGDCGKGPHYPQRFFRLQLSPDRKRTERHLNER